MISLRLPIGIAPRRTPAAVTGRAACPSGRAGWRPAFPDRYLSFATLALLDFVLTCLILSLGGDEANEFARWVMARYGLTGAAGYKFGLVTLVIGLVEFLRGRDAAAASRLANYALIVSAIPVGFALVLLGADALIMGGLAAAP